MLYFIICEDELNMQIQTKQIIKDFVEKNPIPHFKISTFDNFEEVMNYKENEITSEDHCIYLLDIEINGPKNGLQLAKTIREDDYKSEIIFLTSHVELSYNVFKYKLKVLDFINKDFDLDANLYKALKIGTRLYLEKNNDDFLIIKQKSEIYKIAFCDILFIDAKNSSKKITLHTSDYELEFYDSLKSIKSKLDHRFITCHRSYIVNGDKIDIINSDYKDLFLLLHNGLRIPVSRNRIKELKQYVQL